MFGEFDWQNHQLWSGSHVLCRVVIRKEYKGRQIRPEALAIDGMEIELMAGWMMENDDPYPGEWALQPAVRLSEQADLFQLAVGWIASGDVVVLGLQANEPRAVVAACYAAAQAKGEQP